MPSSLAIMARDSLFKGLPPPSSRDKLFEGLPPPSSSSSSQTSRTVEPTELPTQISAPKPAIKRPAGDNDDEGTKRVRFKTTVEASSEQVIGAMQKIAAHISNPAKFSKASKLALQLLQAGSVTKETVDSYYEILRATMSSPSLATEANVKGDYHELFSAVSEQLDCFNSAQQAQLQVWLLWAQVANDLFTDDTFMFSKAAGRIKQAISSLPEATVAEDVSETSITHQMDFPCDKSLDEEARHAPVLSNSLNNQHPLELESDPFGLNVFLPNVSKKEERAKRKKEDEAAARRAREHADRLLREQREALMKCLNIAAGRYKLQWAQTIIDILVKHAFDNISRFTAQQRGAIEKLWMSIREQQIRRRQGKATSDRLDVTAFEQLQNKYAHEKISIRRAVGASGERSAEQWLG